MSSDNYDVGYKKPPKQSQFKPGQSGNPKGRPKGVQNLATDLEEELAQKIVVSEGGKSLETTKQRAMVKTVMAKALKGDVRAANVLINLVLGIEQARAANHSPENLSDEDLAILDQFTQQILAEKQPTSGEQHDE